MIIYVGIEYTRRYIYELHSTLLTNIYIHVYDRVT